MKIKYFLLSLIIIGSLLFTACSEPDYMGGIEYGHSWNNSENNKTAEKNISVDENSSNSVVVKSDEEQTMSRAVKLDSSECEELSYKLDLAITEVSSDEFAITGTSGEVGGMLIEVQDISNNFDEPKYKFYLLTFEGVNYRGEITLSTGSSSTIPYKKGEFYKFNLANINTQQEFRKGLFIDDPLNNLVLAECGN